MESIASLSLVKGKKGYYANIRNLRGSSDEILFHFDTGASMSLIGLNTICGSEETDCEILRNVIEDKAAAQSIPMCEDMPRTVTRERLEVYPCVCHGVSILGMRPTDFYFHIYLGQVSVPLLGFDYIDDCSFQHSVAGDVNISAIANDAGKRFYSSQVLDFSEILKEYHQRIDAS